MKVLCPCGYLYSRGEQHMTLPCGWLLGRHVARRDDIPQGGDSGSGPPRESAGPLDAQPGPPGEVQDLHRYEPTLGTRPGPLRRGPD
jgi:hypothetical protein